jgi:hypothetical protein
MTTIVDADRFRARSSARGTGGNGGGDMDDVLRRLGVVESLVADTRENVSTIKPAFAHLATKADLNELKADVGAIKATLPHLATKADIHATGAEINLVRAEMNLLRADVNALETRIVRWIVGTTIAVASVAFTIAKFVK